MTFGQGTYKPMLEVINYLKDHGFTYYVVSGSDRYIVRALATDVGFDPNHVIGTDYGPSMDQTSKRLILYFRNNKRTYNYVGCRYNYKFFLCSEFKSLV